MVSVGKLLKWVIYFWFSPHCNWFFGFVRNLFSYSNSAHAAVSHKSVWEWQQTKCSTTLHEWCFTSALCLRHFSEWMSAFRSALIFFKIPLSCDKAAVIYTLQLQQLQLHFKIPSYAWKQTGRDSICSSFVFFIFLMELWIAIMLIHSSLHICCFPACTFVFCSHYLY